MNQRIDVKRVVVKAARRYVSPPHQVFGTWLDPGLARQWLFATASSPMARAVIDARVGGSFRLSDLRDGAIHIYAGRYLAVVPPHLLAFTLSLPEWPRLSTQVVVEIAAAPSGCKLTITHENVPADRAEFMKTRWIGMLYGLGVTLESRSRDRVAFEDAAPRTGVRP